MHSEHLIVDNKKMSKSLGNFYTLRDLLQKGYTGKQVRYMLMQTHYKTQLNFTFAGVEAVKGSLQRLQDFIQRLLEIRQPTSSGLVKPVLDKAFSDFAQALADDLNVSAALAALFDMVRELNALGDADRIGKEEEAHLALETLKQFDKVLGILSFEKAIEAIPPDLEEALAKRIEARKQKNWSLADSLRDLITSRGYVIEDTPDGARLKRAEN